MIKRLVGLFFVAVFMFVALFGCTNPQKTVVVYTSVDQVFSEKLFQMFEKQTGIKVKAVYDVEASKSVGLANRLIAEKGQPLADVFWNGEILQTLDLKAKDVLVKADISNSNDLPNSFKDSEGKWFGFGGRARVLIVNTKKIGLDKCPKTMEELVTSPYVKNAGIAYPLFGTTSTQAAALYSIWGDAKAKDYFTRLKAAGIQVVEGNSVVKDFVSQGKLYFGLTDSDDALGEMEKNKDLAILLMDQGAKDIGNMVTPNTVAQIKGAPHPEQADAFMEFLLSKEAEQAMVDDGWIHIPVHAGVTAAKGLDSKNIKIMDIDFAEAYKKLELSKTELEKIFVK
ncbi:MAG: extracellular solute-binding protein [Bacillota bacterium]